MYSEETAYANPVSSVGAWDVPQYSAVVVIGALVFLFLIRKGFRGVNVGGVSLNVR